MKKLLFFFIIIYFVALTGCSRNSDKDAIKVMTLNVRYDNPGDSINAWKNRASIVCNFVKNENPAIIGMQEVLLNQYELLDSVLVDYESVGVGRTDGVKEGEMNPVFFVRERFDLIRTKTFWLSSTPDVPGSMGWGASLPRIVTWMELADKDSHIHFYIFNTHFAHDSDSARVMSAGILLHSVDSIAAGFPFIITGDFNMLPTSRGYAMLTGPNESVPLLKDSYFISDKTPDGPGYTFNGFSDKQGSGRIDYIFVKNGLKVLEQSIIVKKVRGVYISDHWPVEAVVLLKQ